MIVTPEAPVNAVKSAHTASAIIASPPGSQPSSARDRRTSRCGAPPSLSKNPANVKSGIATSTGASAIPKNSIATTDKSISARAKPSIAPAAMIAKSGTPSAASKTSNTPAPSMSSLSAERGRGRAQHIAVRDQRERGGHHDLEPPSRELEQRVSVLVRCSHERVRIPRDGGADGRGERAPDHDHDAPQRRRENAVGELDRDVLAVAARSDRADQREPEHEDPGERIGPDDADREDVAQHDLRAGEQRQRAEAGDEQRVLDATTDAVRAIEPGLA